jgi:hypothetical protein
MKLNASEGNEPRKASSPLPFREAQIILPAILNGVILPNKKLNEQKRGFYSP